jgi:molecular chaperone GrpE
MTNRKTPTPEPAASGADGDLDLAPSGQEPAQAPGQEPAQAPGLEEELAALAAERDDFRDRFMRALAEAENTRKRADRDRREAELYGATRLARDLLPVYDNLRRALEAATEDQRAASAAFIEGVELTMKELTKTLNRHGVTQITPAVGDQFDPALHQAMFEAALPGTRAGQIIQVMAEGFLLNDRLLRPAQVGVSSNTGP